jgi:hypothetical protein
MAFTSVAAIVMMNAPMEKTRERHVKAMSMWCCLEASLLFVVVA